MAAPASDYVRKWGCFPGAAGTIADTGEDVTIPGTLWDESDDTTWPVCNIGDGVTYGAFSDYFWFNIGDPKVLTNAARLLASDNLAGLRIMLELIGSWSGGDGQPYPIKIKSVRPFNTSTLAFIGTYDFCRTGITVNSYTPGVKGVSLPAINVDDAGQDLGTLIGEDSVIDIYGTDPTTLGGNNDQCAKVSSVTHNGDGTSTIYLVASAKLNGSPTSLGNIDVNSGYVLERASGEDGAAAEKVCAYIGGVGVGPDTAAWISAMESGDFGIAFYVQADSPGTADATVWLRGAHTEVMVDNASAIATITGGPVHSTAPTLWKGHNALSRHGCRSWEGLSMWGVTSGGTMPTPVNDWYWGSARTWNEWGNMRQFVTGGKTLWISDYMGPAGLFQLTDPDDYVITYRQAGLYSSGYTYTADTDEFALAEFTTIDSQHKVWLDTVNGVDSAGRGLSAATPVKTAAYLKNTVIPGLSPAQTRVWVIVLSTGDTFASGDWPWLDNAVYEFSGTTTFQNAGGNVIQVDNIEGYIFNLRRGVTVYADLEGTASTVGIPTDNVLNGIVRGVKAINGTDASGGFRGNSGADIAGMLIVDCDTDMSEPDSEALFGHYDSVCAFINSRFSGSTTEAGIRIFRRFDIATPEFFTMFNVYVDPPSSGKPSMRNEVSEIEVRGFYSPGGDAGQSCSLLGNSADTPLHCNRPNYAAKLSESVVTGFGVGANASGWHVHGVSFMQNFKCTGVATDPFPSRTIEFISGIGIWQHDCKMRLCSGAPDGDVNAGFYEDNESAALTRGRVVAFLSIGGCLHVSPNGVVSGEWNTGGVSLVRDLFVHNSACNLSGTLAECFDATWPETGTQSSYGLGRTNDTGDKTFAQFAALPEVTNVSEHTLVVSDLGVEFAPALASNIQDCDPADYADCPTDIRGRWILPYANQQGINLARGPSQADTVGRFGDPWAPPLTIRNRIPAGSRPTALIGVR